ncbi:MAG TPA: pentapeptide repeat-containing protein [Pseudomonadales bacterium]
MLRTHWLAVIAAVLFYFPAQAVACSCWNPTADEFLQSIPIIFEGKVISVTIQNHEKTHAPARSAPKVITINLASKIATTRFEIIDLYKGPESTIIDIKHSTGGRGGCSWEFKEGETVMVAASKNSKNEFYASLCTMAPIALSNEDQNDTSATATIQSTPRSNRFIDAAKEYRKQKIMLERKASNSEDVDVLTNLASFYTNYREYEHALATYDRILAIQRQDPIALAEKANLLFTVGEYDAALAAYENILMINPDDLEAKNSKNIALIKLDRAQELEPSPDLSNIKLNYRDIKKSFSGSNLTGASFRSSSLDLIDLSNSNLSKSTFLHAKVEKSSFKDSILDDADFSNATFKECNFNSASMRGVNFYNSDMTDSSFIGSTIDNANMENAVLAGADLQGTVFINVNLKGAKLGQSREFGEWAKVTDLRGTDFSKSNLDDTHWLYALYDCHTKFPAGFSTSGIRLIPIWNQCKTRSPAINKNALAGSGFIDQQKISYHSIKSNTVFDRINAADSQWEYLELHDAYIKKGIYDRVNLSHSRLTDTTIESASFQQSNLSHAKLHNISIIGGDFHAATLGNADMTSSTISSANFSDANFQFANLTGASVNSSDIRGSDFSDAILEKTRFIRSCYDETTRWPDHFDVKQLSATDCSRWNSIISTQYLRDDND